MSDQINGVNWNYDIINTALNIEQDAMEDISTVLQDVQDNTVGDLAVSGTEGQDLITEYGYDAGTEVNITDAAGAMVVDDLMQKVSTKGQVAAQLLSTANKINQTVSRILQA